MNRFIWKKSVHVCLMTLLISSIAALLQAQENSNLVAKGLDHSHMPVDLPANSPIPGLSLSIYRDQMSGFNLHLSLKNYALSPPPPADSLDMSELMSATANPDSGFAEGHAHLYINGKKISRVYAPDVHLPATLFKPGVNQITITLNSHGHMYWTARGKQILATLFVNPASTTPVLHRFESYPGS